MKEEGRRKSGQTPRRRKTQGNADQETEDVEGNPILRRARMRDRNWCYASARLRSAIASASEISRLIAPLIHFGA